jgi:hypothetical protein
MNSSDLASDSAVEFYQRGEETLYSIKVGNIKLATANVGVRRGTVG